jgi:UDP-GlcNAc:undecaprenyl-phosphate GlcNAc-1-phosphate transferase
LTILFIIMALLGGIVIEAVVLYFLLEMLRDAGAVGKNYLGNEIAVSAGISFPISVLAAYLLYGFFGQYNFGMAVFLFGITSISFLGFIDDMLGKRDVTGFKGHFKALLKGRMTTGGLKAIGGGIIAIYLAVSNPTAANLRVGEVILNILVIALFTNMLNLLDLRPGRAIKGFLVFFALIAVLALGKLEWMLIAPLLGAVIYYFRADLKAMAMMGDAGSNVLGLSLGYLCVINLGLIPRIVVCVFLVALHLYTEKYSLTETIQKIPLLKAVDELGRGGMHD